MLSVQRACRSISKVTERMVGGSPLLIGSKTCMLKVPRPLYACSLTPRGGMSLRSIGGEEARRRG